VSTFGDLKDVFAGLGYVADSTAEGALRTAYLQVLSERRWAFLEESTTATTAAGQREVDLSGVTGLVGVDAVVLRSSADARVPLDAISPQEERDLYASSTATDQPIYWTLYGDRTLRLWPVPNQTYTLEIDYVIEPTSPANDASELVIPASYLDVIAWAAVVPIAARQRDYGGSQIAAGQYERRLQRMTKSLGLRQRSNSSQISHARGFWDSVKT
jgi:hypothetical protein